MAYELFTDEHHLWRQSLRDFVNREIVPNVEAWEEAEALDPYLFKKLGKMGYLGISYPSEYGGGNKDIIFEIILCEEVSRATSGGLAASIMVHTTMAMGLINTLGSHEQKLKYLVPAIKGERIGAFAITEPNAGSDIANIQTYARQESGDYLINGTKTYITNGTIADQFTLAAKTDRSAGYKGISVFVIEKGTPGFEVSRKLKKMGQHTGQTAELALNDVRVPKENLLGIDGKGFYGIMKVMDRDRIVSSSMAAVRGEIVLQHAVSFAKSWLAFGKPIADHQAVRHRLAEMATEIEAARQLTYYGAGKYIEGKDCRKESAMAKWYGAEMNSKVCLQALQLHRDIGCIAGNPIERIFRDARLAPFGGGTTEIMKEIIAKIMDL
jgi:alkylation response protein AidB-like acyl-CoA dehydrogenase